MRLESTEKIKIIHLLLLEKKFLLMPPKPRGRPPKKRRNLAGLQNSVSSSSIPLVSSFSQGRHQAVSEEDDEVLIARSQESHRLPEHNKKDKASSEAEDSGEETDMEDYAESDWDELDDQDFAERLAEMVMEDDPNDFDWVPAKFRKKQMAKKKGKTNVLS